MFWMAVLYTVLSIAVLSGLTFGIIGIKVRGKGLEIGVLILFSFFGALMFPLTIYRLVFKRDVIVESLKSTKDMF